MVNIVLTNVIPNIYMSFNLNFKILKQIQSFNGKYCSLSSSFLHMKKNVQIPIESNFFSSLVTL